MKLYGYIDFNEEKCHAQEPQPYTFLNKSDCPLLFLYCFTFQGYISDTPQVFDMKLHGCIDISEENCNA